MLILLLACIHISTNQIKSEIWKSCVASTIETKQILQQNDPFQVGFQDCIRLIMLVLSVQCILPTWFPHDCMISPLPSNPEKFKTAVEIIAKAGVGCAHMEHLLSECAESPSKHYRDCYRLWHAPITDFSFHSFLCKFVEVTQLTFCFPK